MEIKLTETEVLFLAKTYGDASVKFEFTGENTFTVHHPKATVPCEIIGFTKRSIRIQYELGFFKNLLVKLFVSLEKEGIIWNKRDKQIDMDPFSFLPQKEKKVTEDFSIQEFTLQPGSLLIRLGIMPE